MKQPAFDGFAMGEPRPASPGVWAEKPRASGGFDRAPVIAFVHAWRSFGVEPHHRYFAMIPDPQGAGLVVAETLGYCGLSWFAPGCEPCETWRHGIADDRVPG